MLLASPMAIVVALSRASRSGIQVKAGPFVEASATLQTVVFDKTGTLTTGKFIVPEGGVRTVPGVAAADLLKLAATIESRSTHPLARAIVDYAKSQSIVPSEPADMNVLEGLGIEATVDQHVARAGSLKILDAEQRAAAVQLDAADESLAVVPVYVTHKGKLLGGIYLTDEIRPEAARTISRLRQLGIKNIAMLTGDRRQTAELVGRAVGVDEVFAELLPGQKVDIVRQLQRGGRGVAVIGDGINDSPALAAATLGVAMGVRGTDVAIQAAHAVLLKDDLTRVPLLIYLAQQTRWAIYQNLGFACVFAGLAEAAAAAGWLNPVMAALVHVLAVVVIAINSIRLAGTGSRKRPTRNAVEPTETPAAAPSRALEPALQPA
jgi:P-type E1-E2 ATPase